jgi:hypothetical protein
MLSDDRQLSRERATPAASLGQHGIGDLFHRWSPPAGVTERATSPLGDCVTYRRLGAIRSIGG